MKLKYTSPVLVSFIFASCFAPPQLFVRNQIEHKITINYQTPFDPIPAQFTLSSPQDTVLSFEKFPFDDGDLILLVVSQDGNTNPTYLRFSGSYLTKRHPGLTLPFTIPDSVKLHKLLLREELDAIANHSSYFLIQDLYNAKRYAECLNAVESITPAFLSSYRPDDLKGITVLAYLSALKLKQPGRAETYWKLIERAGLGYSKYLKENDIELLTLHAG